MLRIIEGKALEERIGFAGSLNREFQHFAPLIVAVTTPAGDFLTGTVTTHADIFFIQRADVYTRGFDRFFYITHTAAFGGL